MEKIISFSRWALLSLLFLALYTPSTAQEETPWKVTGNAGIAFSQVALSNWAEGGDQSVSGTLLINIDANKTWDEYYWNNGLDIEYGILKNEGENSSKSVDRLDLESKYGKKISEKWAFAAYGEFKTQFAKGYDDYTDKSTYISTFMAPAYLNTSLGFDYLPNKNLTLYLSPLSSKMTFVTDDSLSNVGSFGVDEGDKFRFELGAYVKVDYIKEKIIPNVDLKTSIDFFSSYTENPLNIDINWELLLSMKINDFLAATLSTQIKYDDDVDTTNSDDTTGGPAVQFKEVLGVGLNYKF